jgi:hypothetical protein
LQIVKSACIVTPEPKELGCSPLARMNPQVSVEAMNFNFD